MNRSSSGVSGLSGGGSNAMVMARQQMISQSVIGQKMWQETIAKENRHQVFKQSYTTHPKNIHAISEKPTQARWWNLKEKEGDVTDRAASELSWVRSLKDQNQLHQTTDKQPNNHHQDKQQKLKQKLKSQITDEDDLVNRVLSGDKAPTLKYEYPITRNMEYGWFNNQLANTGIKAPSRYGPTNKSDITKYADAYVANHGFHPFSTKQYKYVPSTTPSVRHSSNNSRAPSAAS